jgi:hypothetical protein
VDVSCVAAGHPHMHSPCLTQVFLVCRPVTFAFMRALDVDYEALFTCPICSRLDHSQQAIIIDGAVSGINRARVADYIPPYAAPDTPFVPETWCDSLLQWPGG